MCDYGAVTQDTWNNPEISLVLPTATSQVSQDNKYSVIVILTRTSCREYSKYPGNLRIFYMEKVAEVVDMCRARDRPPAITIAIVLTIHISRSFAILI